MEVRERRSRRPRREPAGPSRPARAARRAALGALFGGLVMFGAATAVALTGARLPMIGATGDVAAANVGGTTSTSAVPPLARAGTAPGSCLVWRRPDAGDAADVPCASPHLFELAAAVQLGDPATAPFPTDPQWRALVERRCTPAVSAYLHGRYDPNGRFRVGALKPTVRGWSAGDRVLRCGLQSPRHSGALVATTGRVADVDQADTHPPGTCLGLDGTEVADPVDCARPHAVEVVAVVDLAQKFSGAAPGVADQDAFLQPTCAKLAEDYLGGPGALAERKLTVYWPNLAPESWAAGTHTVTCNLAAQLRGGGFAPLTGSARQHVTIGTTPAPASGTTVPPTTGSSTTRPPATTSRSR